MQRKGILIVEDDEDIREALALVLENEGYPVFSASNGKEGLDLFPTLPDLCLILLDLMMPVMDGFEFLVARKQDVKLSKVPVVVISAFPERARELAADGCLKKPIQVNDILNYINQHCT